MSQSLESPSKPSKRFLLYGCIGVLVGIAALVVCCGIGGYFYYASQIDTFTDAKPLDLPRTVYEPTELKKLESKIHRFKESGEAEKSDVEELSLSADDLNALIDRADQLKGRIHIKLVNNQVVGDVSIPTDALKIPGAQGRFLNATVTLNVKLDDGVLIVRLNDAEVRGRKLPKFVLDSISERNLAEKITEDPKTAKIIATFEDISVEDDRLVLRRK